MRDVTLATPHVFLSYTAADTAPAKRIAEFLSANGIRTWWDKWCIYPGDSLRQKIDEGLSGCSHFLVLLTPASIGKPWVNQEMDAALVRKLNGHCKFLPLLDGIPASKLPALLAGMHAPTVVSDEDILQLVNDIYGVARAPALGAMPVTVISAPVGNCFSAAANAVARYFVEHTKHALRHDPSIEVKDLADKLALTVADATDAIDDLGGLYSRISWTSARRGHVVCYVRRLLDGMEDRG